MSARKFCRTLSPIAAALLALAAAPASALAQDGSDWDQWDTPRRMRTPPESVYPDDDQDSEQQNQRPQYEGRRYRDDRDTSTRREFQRRYRNPSLRNPNYDEPNEEFDQRDTAREPDGDAEQNKIAGVDGGPRPDIPPQAPQEVPFNAPTAPGTIIIDTSARKLYYITSPGAAFAYPIGVGREGFAWTGSEKVSRVTDWPDWYPPAEMRKRKPELPERMLGGLRNPLGAKAIYLGNTLYRIHGTNDPKSIGKAESSGCFRMLNNHVLHLASLVHEGTQVTIVKSLNSGVVAAAKPQPARPVVAVKPALKPKVTQRLPPRVVQRTPQRYFYQRRYRRDYDPYFDDDGR
jgi:lipoprotein-anchoring transpeptidase ErfK/SrfK